MRVSYPGRGKATNIEYEDDVHCHRRPFSTEVRLEDDEAEWQSGYRAGICLRIVARHRPAIGAISTDFAPSRSYRSFCFMRTSLHSAAAFSASTSSSSSPAFLSRASSLPRSRRGDSATCPSGSVARAGVALHVNLDKMGMEVARYQITHSVRSTGDPRTACRDNEVTNPNAVSDLVHSLYEKMKADGTLALLNRRPPG